MVSPCKRWSTPQILCAYAQVKAPRIEESAVQFECILRHTYDVKNK